MWKLVVITTVLAGGLRGGSDIDVAVVEFDTQAACEKAVEFIERDGFVDKTTRLGYREVEATCIQDGPAAK